MDHDKIAKLPKWAQSIINSLQIRCGAAEKINDEIGGKRKTNIRLSIGMGKTLNLPSNSSIELVTKNGKINLNLREDVLQIYGDKKISIEPRASNSCYISVDGS